MKTKTQTQTQTHYSTRQAAEKIGVSFRTLNRWIATKAIKASQGIPLTNGGFLWLWTDEDIAKCLKVKATMKPGKRRKVEAKR